MKLWDHHAHHELLEYPGAKDHESRKRREQGQGAGEAYEDPGVMGCRVAGLQGKA